MSIMLIMSRLDRGKTNDHPIRRISKSILSPLPYLACLRSCKSSVDGLEWLEFAGDYEEENTGEHTAVKGGNVPMTAIRWKREGLLAFTRHCNHVYERSTYPKVGIFIE